MKLLSKFLLVLIAFFVLSGCGDGDNSFNPTDPDAVFNLFPSDYFIIGYSESYSLSGFDTAGGLPTGSLSMQTQSQEIFNGELAIPISVALQVVNTQTGSFINSTGIGYYSTDENDRRELGFTNITLGTSTFIAVTSAIPATAKIGDSGEIGSYIDNLGNRDVKTWQLLDGGDGRASLVFSSTTRDQVGLFLSSAEESYLIEQNGDRVSVEFRLFDADSGATLTLSGNKI